MWLNFTVALVCAAILLLAAWGVKDKLLTPVQFGNNTEISVIVKVKGNEPMLEETMRELAWLIESGLLNAPVTVKLTECDGETWRIAEICAFKYKNITIDNIGDADGRTL